MNLKEALESNSTTTQNGMPTHESSLSHVLDLFYHIGGLRKGSHDLSVQKVVHDNIENVVNVYSNSHDKCQILIDLFSKALAEDAERAMKTLFWARDIRGGAGERQIFKDVIYYLAVSQNKDYLLNNLQLIPHYGRWDDLLMLVDTPLEEEAFALILRAITLAISVRVNIDNGLVEGYMFDEYKNMLSTGMNAAKWMPRKGRTAAKLRKYMQLSPKQYRKILVSLTDVVEQKMTNNKWGDIDFSKVPSLAAARYQSAFYRWQTKRYKKYLKQLQNNETTINAGAVYPYDVIKSIRNANNSTERQVAEQQWNALPDLMKNCNDYILPLIDTSGSMTLDCVFGSITPIDIAISLGLYISERNTGPFKDSFITFSEAPDLQYLKGSITDRLHQMQRVHWGFNTNIELVFQLILDQALRNNVAHELMPNKILIISDMEFDMAVENEDLNFMSMVREKYENSGYNIPQIIFWNLNSKNKGIPVQKNDAGVAMVSGFSTSILKSILEIDDLTPLNIMDNTIMSSRYEPVKI
jgi:hypothetical protein